MGANPMKDSAQNVLVMLGRQYKCTQKTIIKREQKPLLHAALDAYPHHAFSVTGQRNICKRHGVTDPELGAVLLTYERPDEPTEAERRAADLAHVLRVIEAAVTPVPKRKAAPRKAKKGGGACQ